MRGPQGDTSKSEAPDTGGQPQELRPSVRVLIVEDNPADARYVEDLLTDYAGEFPSSCLFSCTIAATLADAIAHLQYRSVDVILIDLSLPDASYLDGLTKIQKVVPEVPVVVLTGLEEETTAAQAVRQGAQDFLPKGSISGDLLTRTVRYAIERKQAEARMRESELRFRTIFEDSPIGICLVSLDEARLLKANKAFCQMLDHGESELLSLTIPQLTFSEDRHKGELIAEQIREHKVQAARLELRLCRRLGQAVWAQLTATVMADRGGEALYCVLMVEDISDRKQTERTLKELIGLEQREDFMAMLTHDLKTPLVGANMVLGALADASLGPLSAAQAEIINKLKLSNHALLKMIQNLLEVYRYESGSTALVLRTVDLAQVVEYSVEEVKPLIVSKHLSLHVALPQSPCPAVADEDAMRRVLINVIGNAIKFTPEEGTINISLSADGDQVIIRVSDTGVGISAQDQDRLFQRFWQGDPGKRYSVGTGLGLYFCHRVMEAHKGRITCQSEAGSGTTFEIMLPAAV